MSCLYERIYNTDLYNLMNYLYTHTHTYFIGIVINIIRSRIDHTIHYLYDVIHILLSIYKLIAAAGFDGDRFLPFFFFFFYNRIQLSHDVPCDFRPIGTVTMSDHTRHVHPTCYVFVLHLFLSIISLLLI